MTNPLYLFFNKYRKIFALMRNLFIMILIIGLQAFSAGTYSQTTKISLNKKNSTVKEVLTAIENQTEFYFLYNSDLVDVQRKVDVTVSKSGINEILASLFSDGGVNYTISDRHIVLIPAQAQAQQASAIKGGVTDRNGEPLPGVTVVVKGTTVGTITDMNGQYSLSAVPDDGVLVFSFLGMVTQEAEVAGRTQINVTLLESSIMLDEVISTGYQTISRERSSGSFDKIDGKLFEERPNADIASSMNGMIPGFQRLTTTNSDGSLSYSFQIRGQGTLTQSIASPLIVVDGFPVDDSDFSTINPNNVESVTVLKDAAAASIWGARAANGVIVVTTKNGSKGTRNFEVKVSAFARMSSKLDLDYINPIANTETQVAWEKYVYDNNLTGNLTPSSLGEVTTSLSPTLTLYNEYKLGNLTQAEYDAQMAQLTAYNYQDDVYKHLLQKSLYQQYNLGITGSTERNNYSFSALYDISKSDFVGDTGNKALINFRDNFIINDWLKFNVGATFKLQSEENNGATLSEIKRMPSYQRLLDDNGDYVPMVKDYYLPILDQVSATGNFPYDNWNYNLLEETRLNDNTVQSNTVRLQAGFNVTFLKGLTWDSKIQYEKGEQRNKNIYSEDSYLVRNQVNRYNAYDSATGTVTIQSADGYAYPQGSALDKSTYDRESYVFRNQVQFDRLIGEKHNILALVGSEISSYVTQSETQVRLWGYDDDRLTFANQPFYDDYGAPQFYTTSKTRLSPGKDWGATYTDNRFFSLYGNFSYTYDGKYTLTASLRTDASNMIVKDPKYRYAPFWSVGGRWSLEKESFMQGLDYVNRLQLRASYGVSGNVVTSTSVVPLISYSSGPNSYTGDYYATVQDFGNPLLRWEKTSTVNVGLDYALFKNQLVGKIDYYSKHSEDILASVDIAGAYGLGYSNSVNGAEILNHGIELELGTTQHITPQMKWNGRLVMSRNVNEVKSLDVNSYYPARLTQESVYVEGRPIKPVYSYVYTGDVDGIPTIQFNDGQTTNIFNIPTTSDARSYLQYEGSLIPTTEFGFNNTFEYKQFALSALITGRFGHVFRAEAPGYDLLNNSAMSTLSKPMEEVLSGDPTKFPGLPPTNVPDLSTYSMVQYFNTLVEDASNIRMKEVMLSWSIPNMKLQNLNLSGIKVYAQVKDIGVLWKATDTYYDPDYLYYKPATSYLLGLNVSF